MKKGVKRPKEHMNSGSQQIAIAMKALPKQRPLVEQEKALLAKEVKLNKSISLTLAGMMAKGKAKIVRGELVKVERDEYDQMKRLKVKSFGNIPADYVPRSAMEIEAFESDFNASQVKLLRLQKVLNRVQSDLYIVREKMRDGSFNRQAASRERHLKRTDKGLWLNADETRVRNQETGQIARMKRDVKSKHTWINGELQKRMWPAPKPVPSPIPNPDYNGD